MRDNNDQSDTELAVGTKTIMWGLTIGLIGGFFYVHILKELL